MKTYYVSIPIAGRILFEVKSSSESGAKRVAAATYAASASLDAVDVEWDAYETLNEITVSRLKYKGVEATIKRTL